MKAKTDPKTGNTICTLEDKDRNKLAAAKDVLSEWSHHIRGQAGADELKAMADEVGALLAGSKPWQKPSAKPEPPAK